MINPTTAIVPTPGDPPARTDAGDGAGSLLSLKARRQMAEREAIVEALRKTDGQVSAAARALGISRAQLYRLIGHLRVQQRTFEPGSGAPAP